MQKTYFWNASDAADSLPSPPRAVLNAPRTHVIPDIRPVGL
jgi:hypothetical protein